VRGIDGRKRFKGLLIGLEGADVVMNVTDADEGNRQMRFPFDDIAEAKLVLTDRLIQESLKAREKREAKTSH